MPLKMKFHKIVRFGRISAQASKELSKLNSTATYLPIRKLEKLGKYASESPHVVARRQLETRPSNHRSRCRQPFGNPHSPPKILDHRSSPPKNRG